MASPSPSNTPLLDDHTMDGRNGVISHPTTNGTNGGIDPHTMFEANGSINHVEMSDKPVIDDCGRCILNIKAIAHAHLSVFYPPGAILLEKVPNLRWGTALRLEHSEYQIAPNGERSLALLTHFVGYNGVTFGKLPRCLHIPHYQGPRDIRSLECVPLSLHTDKDEARERLGVRGVEYQRLTKGRHVMQYISAVDFTGRVVVDYEGILAIKGMGSSLVENCHPDFEPIPFNKRENGELVEEDSLLLPPTIMCLSVPGAKVVHANIDEIEPTKWNNRCFEDELVLDSLTTKTFKALIKAHAHPALLDDNVLRTAGKGLIFVFHGPPGVGKTRAVECCAEYIERPFFTLKSGWVGAEASGISSCGIVDPTMLMNASLLMCGVLLVRDADQFLDDDKKGAPSFKKFWQALEQYPGIVFLVARSRPTFNGPVASMICLSKRYSKLNDDSRKKIWRILYSKVSGGVTVTDDEYSKLAETKLNGHQVKSVIKAAEAVAKFDKKRVNFQYLEDALTTQEVLEEENWSSHGII